METLEKNKDTFAFLTIFYKSLLCALKFRIEKIPPPHLKSIQNFLKLTKTNNKTKNKNF